MAFKYITEDRTLSVPLSRRVVFITEGVDDAVFLEHVLSGRGEDHDQIEIRYVKGIGNLPTYVAGLVKEPAFTRGQIDRICVIVDADDDFASAEVRLTKALVAASLPAPLAGERASKGELVVGSYILPRKGVNGMLEDLILETVKGEKRTDAATTAVNEINSLTPLDKTSKRTMQIFLALSVGDLCRGPGQAIRNGAIPFDHTHFEELNEFLDVFFAP